VVRGPLNACCHRLVHLGHGGYIIGVILQILTSKLLLILFISVFSERKNVQKHFGLKYDEAFMVTVQENSLGLQDASRGC
jgi:hypothetical protein